ncbi:type IV conjugative transfer system coupling protein TraD [Yokenella regensburgei]|uniref:type IV conjugative transfer system coupling protein TraD n=1 Tax=Yokenella regensburgei TaxID=158877 RepID=UPI0027D9805E|nr:type IV conjugative transfer system coupling protein TraD [Yokenella regensburgei]MDQ4429088.1 type IV conjugative transfer system coupling protein TraD [Yokenella regensburgei]
MSFAGKYLMQGGQMTAYRWRMFLQVNNWIGYWVFLLFLGLGAAIFYLSTPSETMDNGTWYWISRINESFTILMSPGKGRVYDIHYYYAPANTMLTLKMSMQQILADPYMQVMGQRMADSIQRAAIISGCFSLAVFTAVGWFVTRVGRRESEDEYISGMTLTDKPNEVNRMLKRNGELSDLRVGDLHMVKHAEVMNFLIHGTIGVGKSTLIRWLLDFIRKRGDRAIIYDSGCTFTETHYNPATDFILNAHDERCANWQMWGECIDAVDYDNMASSLIPVEGESDPFWVSSSRTIFADLAIRMSADPDRSIEKFLKTLLSLSMKSLREYLANTPSANLVEEKIEKTAISIRSVVTNYAKALRYLQGLDDGVKPPFTIREWMTQEQHSNSWLFISTQARHRKSVRPLISLWVSLATLMLQSMGENSERRVWFIYDEIPSLQRIPELNETLAEGRKFGGCFVLGAQNMAQLIHVYGRELARSLFDLLNTRMYGRSPSAEMAKVVEEELGNQRKREIREQNSYGMDKVRDGVSLGKDKVNNPIVDYEQIMRLPNLSFYVRLPGEYPVVRLKLKYRAQTRHHQGLIERNIRDVLSPELERVIQENERAATTAGISFPTGDEMLEGGPVSSAPEPVPTKPASPAKPAAAVMQKVPPLSVPVTAAEKPVPKTLPAEPVQAEARLKAEKSVNPSPLRPDNTAHLRSSARTPEARPETVPLSSAGSALDLLYRRQQQTAAPVEEDDSDGGESMSLEMKVESLPDGGLQLTSADIHEDLSDEEYGHTWHKATHIMAREEENILHHRHPEDPGYDDHDVDHYDGEREL